MTKEQAKKIILISENDIDSGAIEIDSSIVYDEGWEHLGDDFYINKDGVAGPSIGDPTRTYQSFENIKENYGI